MIGKVLFANFRIVVLLPLVLVAFVAVVVVDLFALMLPGFRYVFAGIITEPAISITPVPLSKSIASVLA